MDPRLAPLAEIFRLNTRLLHNCLDGFTDERALQRLAASTNSATFIAAHVVDSRYFILSFVGDATTSPLAPWLAGKRGIDDCTSLPPLDVILSAADDSDTRLQRALAALVADDVDRPIETRLPVAEPRMSSALAFFAQHDSYHVGQLALLRKEAGLPAMRYR